jgi:hypothetical protein
MYLAPRINRRIAAMRDVLRGSVPLETVLDLVQSALKPFGIRVYLMPDDTLTRPDFTCGGLYDFQKKRQPIDIVLHFHEGNRCFNFTKKNWTKFSFLLSQVVQHELIHKCQYSHRQEIENGGATLYYDIKAGEKSDKEHMDYLAELDEIEAYAHDIALEILHHYPTMDPYAVLSSINRRRRLWSWNYYRDAFKYSEDWSDVRHRLLKKTYQWLPIVIEYQRKSSIKSMT